MYLTEQDFIKNFKSLFNYDCPFFAKLLYLHLSKGYNKSKIALSTLIKTFLPLLNEKENAKQIARLCF